MNLNQEYDQAQTSAVLFDVSARAKIQLTGKDAGLFLHNLCTNDINRLPVGGGCEAFLATAQARLVAYVLIYHSPAQQGTDFWLDADVGTAEKIVQHLDRHLISEQVEIHDRTQEFAQLRLAGPRALEMLASAASAAVPELRELQHVALLVGETQCFVRRHSRLELPGCDLLIPTDHAADVQQRLVKAGAHAAGPETHEVLRVEGGTPVYGVDLDETRLVMDVGRTQAVSYNKGCYLGQEPIVMARDRGHANRKLLGLRLSAGQTLPGTRLLLEGKEVGQLTSCVQSPRLGAIALGYVRRGHQNAGTMLELADGTRAEVVPLPFPPGPAS